jgi:hypothetical protein
VRTRHLDGSDSRIGRGRPVDRRVDGLRHAALASTDER